MGKYLDAWTSRHPEEAEQAVEAEETYEPVPNEEWLKSDIVGWLEERDMEVPGGATKNELLDIVNTLVS